MKANNNQTNAEKKLGKLPVWKLKDLYSSQNDKNLSADLNNIKKETKKFEKKYLSKVKLLSAEKLNQSGTLVVFDGDQSCLINKRTYQVTALRREEGNFMLDVWIPPAAVSRQMGFARQP